MSTQFLPVTVSRDISNLPEPADDRIQDGILNEFRYVPLTNSFDTLAVDQLHTVRLANGMRPYHLPIPDAGTTIAPYDTYQRQFSVPSGSLLLGFVTANAEVSNLFRRLSIKDSCTGLPLFSDFIGGRALYTGIETPIGVQLLSAPRLIGDPGTIDIELSQITSGSSAFYLVLLFATPVVSLPIRRYTNPGGIR